MAQDSKRGKGPVLSLYTKIKKQYKDVIILIRVGDFYMTFGDDAKTFSNAVGATIQYIPINGKKTTTAGVLYSTVDANVEKCLELGHKVALVDPIEIPDHSSMPNCTEEKKVRKV